MKKCETNNSINTIINLSTNFSIINNKQEEKDPKNDKDEAKTIIVGNILNNSFSDNIYPENESKNKKLPLLKFSYKEKTSYNYYLYEKDDMTTYAFIKNSLIEGSELKTAIQPKENCIKNEKYNLFFCKMLFEYDEINNNKIICAPDSGICRECMKVNKQKHKLSGHLLININGRCTKLNKNELKFNCYGHFNGEENEEICGNNGYICKACKIISSNMKYYLGEKELKRLKEKYEKNKNKKEK